MQMLMGDHTGAVSDSELGALYPWPSDRRWVRGMMVTTLDGAAHGSNGASGPISSAADKVIFNETRRLADAVLVGANTMRIERYRPMVAKPEFQDERSAAGLRSAPVVVLVSASLNLPWEEDIFSKSTFTPIVVTGSAPDPARLSAAGDHCEVVQLPGHQVNPQAIIDLLVERGLRRIVCEGGPNLLRDIASAGLLDEADISIAPLIAGGGQILTGTAFADAQRYRLEHIIEDEGFLFNRYVSVSPERT
jgi:riboflavin biosynthesis pyrimidine reductase